jgi:hypothetical protein
MNVGGVLMLAFIGSTTRGSAAQAAFAISYSQLFSLITWTSGRADGRCRRDRRAEPRRRAIPIAPTKRAHRRALRALRRRDRRRVFLVHSAPAASSSSGMTDPTVVAIGSQLLRVLSVSGLLITVALAYTGGLQGTGDTKSPLYISIVSQIIVPLASAS